MLVKRAYSFNDLVVTAAILITALIVGCGEKEQPTALRGQTGLATMRTTIGATPFTLEIADTDTERETGLMYRTSMPADHGMIFVFDQPQELNFYMANTRIPLDIAFLDARGNVISIKSMIPLDLRLTHSDGQAKYAIEMDQGAAEHAGLKVGDHVDVSPGQLH